jgi:transposase
MKHKFLFPESTLFKGRFEQRATIVALRMGGADCRSIALFASIHLTTVHRWVCRVEEGRPLDDMKRSGRPRRISEASRITTIAVYCQHTPPLPGVYRWSLRDAHSFFKEHPNLIGEPISRSTIHRILLEHSLRPHRRKYYLQITDPDFFPKMEHIIECYSNLPTKLYCFDECTCIQALDRITPTLPTAENQPTREDFDYRRNGTTDLLAFLNPATGTVYGQCTDNHDRHALCHVFSSHVRMHPSDSVLHYIMDNLSAHYHDDFCRTVAELSGTTYSPLKRGAERRHWLQSPHKRIVVHFVPFHASWLNMVEIWFGILKKRCLNYDHFTSVPMLREAIMNFIETWNGFYAHPFKWSYTGKGLHQKAVRRFCLLLSIETPQMDCKFLTRQLLLMSNIAESYLQFLPVADWLRLINLANEKKDYIRNIIDSEPGPKRKQQGMMAHDLFETVIQRPQLLDRAA